MDELNNFKKTPKKDKTVSIKVTSENKNFLKKNKISPSKIFDGALDKLKEQLKRETKVWD